MKEFDIENLSQEEKEKLLKEMLEENIVLKAKIKEKDDYWNKRIQKKNRKIDALSHRLSRKEKEIANLNLELAEYLKIIEKKDIELSYYRRKIFGSTSEKQRREDASKDKDIKPKQKKKPGRKKDKSISENLCSDDSKKETYIEDEYENNPDYTFVSEEIVSNKVIAVPARYKVIQILRRTYRDKNGNLVTTTINNASFTSFPNSYLTPEFLASLAVDKYELGLPLYRMEKYFKGIGLNISRQALSNYLIDLADMLEPMVGEYKVILISKDLLGADETTQKVLSEKKKCYMWVFGTMPHEKERIKFYQFEIDRKGDRPKEFLKGFKGYLISDAYSGYNKVENIKRVFCYAHLKRKFNAITYRLDDEQKKKSEAYRLELLISEIYKKDNEIFVSSESFDEIKEKRKEIIKPLVDNLFNEFDDKLENSTGKLHEAISYAKNNKEGFFTFLEDGRIPLDNNYIEGEVIKPFVIDRKNFLFSNTGNGARATAIIMTVLLTATANGLNGFEYLTYLIRELQTKRLPANYQEYYPWNESMKKKFGRPIKMKERGKKQKTAK